MKNINDLTEKEAKEILEFVFPDKKDYEKYFREISFEPVFDEDGKHRITFGFRPIIGILYHNGQDNCILHFDDSKAVLWLYKNGYDITEMLEKNSYFSDMENEFFKCKSAIYSLNRRQESIPEDKKHLFTLEYVLKELKRIEDKYINC